MILLMGGLAILLAVLVRKGPAFGEALRQKRAAKTTQAETAQTHTPHTSKCYFETAIKLGALVASFDDVIDPKELTSLKRVFNLSEGSCQGIDDIYQAQLETPQKLTDILAPYLQTYGPKSPTGETLLFGMTSVAMADGRMSESELGIIRQAGQMLGFEASATNRIMMLAGYFGANTDAGPQHRKTAYQASRAPSGTGTQRDLHLRTLGLPTTANKETIRKAWRKLAAKHHPDTLASQNLPATEIERAEDKMLAINEAYNWLKDHTA